MIITTLIEFPGKALLLGNQSLTFQVLSEPGQDRHGLLSCGLAFNALQLRVHVAVLV